MSDVALAIAGRAAAVRARVERAAARAGRAPGEIALVAVAKRKSAEDVVAAVAAGVRRVGENYVQEALEKIPEVEARLAARGLAPPRWHFVGRLQRNKARQVAPHFHCVETLDRTALGDELERRAAAAGRTLDALLQVNLSGEVQKGGVPPGDLPELLAAATAWKHLRLVGLMAIPAAARSPEESRPAFAELRRLRDTLRRSEPGAGLSELSMGMSADFEVAIEEGATIIRVGTALFGPREG